MVSLLEEIETASGLSYASFSILVRNETQKRYMFMALLQNYEFFLLLSKYSLKGTGLSGCTKEYHMGPLYWWNHINNVHNNQNRWAKVVHTLEAWEGTYGMIGNNHYKDWETQHMSEVCRGPMVCGLMGHSLKVRAKNYILQLSLPRK